MRIFFISATLIILAVNISLAQPDSVRNFNYYYNQAMAAYQNGDFAGFRDNFIEVVRLRPENPAASYNLACGYALTGENDKALDLLEDLAEKGIDFGVDRDSDFKSLRDMERFKSICDKLTRIRKTVNNSEVAFTVPEKDLIPEGIAFDPVNETIFLSSIYKRKIVSICKKGTVKDFIFAGQDGIWAVLGMEVDPKRRILWVCNSSSNQMKNFKPDDSGKAAIHKYDLTGKLVKKYTPPENEYHEFNDLVVNSDGDVYITDSHTGEIFFIHHQRDTLELLFEEGLFAGSNGITLSDDDKLLFIAAYSEGIYVANTADRNFELLKVPENSTAYSIDGLYFYDNSLIAVQNGINPDRIARFYLNDKMDAAVDVEIIEMNNEFFDEPTTGTIGGDIFYFIANSQLRSYDRDGNLLPLDSLKDVVILKTQL